MYESFFSGLSAVLTMIISLGFVLFLAWYLLNWMGKRSNNQGCAGAIKVLDKVVVGREKTLLLIKVGSKTMLVAFSDGAATNICEFGADEVFDKAELPLADFSSVLQKVIFKKPSKTRQKEDKHEQ